eukprot:1156119-Pelagomonas_calceolata.AAC.10
MPTSEDNQCVSTRLACTCLIRNESFPCLIQKKKLSKGFVQGTCKGTQGSDECKRVCTNECACVSSLESPCVIACACLSPSDPPFRSSDDGCLWTTLALRQHHQPPGAVGRQYLTG